MLSLETTYSDYSYTVKYKDLEALLERLEELQVLMYDLISFYISIDTIDYRIDNTVDNQYLITFYGKGYIKNNPPEISEPPSKEYSQM